MWNTKKNNLICGYLDAYENQKKHIERVLSAKDLLGIKKPFVPKFLKLKTIKQKIEDEKNNKIKNDNKTLLIKILEAEEKPSQYSQINNEPKKCPAFNKEIMNSKRMKKDFLNFQENVKFYSKIENVKSNYSISNLKARNNSINNDYKRLQKSFFELSPNLLFLSPTRIKNEIEKYKNQRLNKSNSICFRNDRPLGKLGKSEGIILNNKKIEKIEKKKKIDKNKINKKERPKSAFRRNNSKLSLN